MRCQALRKAVGFGTKRCIRDAVPGFDKCTRCRDQEQRKEDNKIETAFGKPGKNVGWRDPELRAYVRGLKCCLAEHPLHTCEPRPDRYKIECNHVDPKAHAGDHDKLLPRVPSSERRSRRPGSAPAGGTEIWGLLQGDCSAGDVRVHGVEGARRMMQQPQGQVTARSFRKGAAVTVVHGHYAGRSGTIVEVHDPSVRERRFEVQFADKRVLCFSAGELGNTV